MPYSRTTNRMAGDEQLTKEEKKQRRKAEKKKERKAEKKAAKKRKRESVESADNDNGIGNNGRKAKAPKPSEAAATADAEEKSSHNRARANSTASAAMTHHSVTEDTIAQEIGANVPQQIISSAAGTATAATSKHDATNKLSYQLQKIRTLVSLAPSSLKDVTGNIRRLCCEDITRYVGGLGGVLMAVRDIKVMGNGYVLSELPHIHFDVEADVVVFCPDIGLRLVGVVNESFPSHVGMLVDTIFNAMVPAEELRALGYDYDTDTNQWSTERNAKTGELLASPLPIGAEDRIEFTVTKMHEANGIISLEGADPDMLS
mmetsp:Transcript_6677/g.14656  ORF Transcript_6677/g.14656 Transcript_6677/m.14656 type:complete len:317 (+) Transcript_6677:171-1121(+)